MAFFEIILMYKPQPSKRGNLLNGNLYSPFIFLILDAKFVRFEHRVQRTILVPIID